MTTGYVGGAEEEVGEESTGEEVVVVLGAQVHLDRISPQPFLHPLTIMPWQGGNFNKSQHGPSIDGPEGHFDFGPLGQRVMFSFRLIATTLANASALVVGVGVGQGSIAMRIRIKMT